MKKLGMNSEILSYYVDEFWSKRCSHDITLKDKVKIASRISKFSRNNPEYVYLSYDDPADNNGNTLSSLFPELIPSRLCTKHNHIRKLYGLMLYAIYSGIRKEMIELKKLGKLGKTYCRVLETLER